MMLALELFAWGPLLGLALLFAAPVFRGGKLQAGVRIGMILGGALCVGNILCFALGDVRFSVLGIAGYAPRSRPGLGSSGPSPSRPSTTI